MKQKEAEAFDWLFNATTQSCSEWEPGGWDNDSTTLFSRLFLITFYLVALAAVFAVSRGGGRRRSSHKLESPAAHLETQSADCVGKNSEDSAAIFCEIGSSPQDGGEANVSPARRRGSSTSTPKSDLSHVATEVHGTDHESVSEKVDIAKERATPAKRTKERMWHLDFARILCVACVVTEHSGGSENYTLRNVFFVLQWVLPFLYLTSGICFMLSSTSVWLYLLRLSIVLLVGVSANWIADISTGRDWQNNFGDTVFQMFYVVMLIILALSYAPLRQTLRWRKRQPVERGGLAIWAQAVVFGVLTAWGFGYYLSRTPVIKIDDSGSGWLMSAAPVLNVLPLVVLQVAGTSFVCLFSLLIGEADGWLGWILLAVIYVPRIIIPFSNVGYTHNVELYLFAMVIQAYKLKGSEAVVKYGRAYWPLVLAVALGLAMPSMSGRCDLDPPNTYWERFRFYAVEFVLTVAFTTGVFNTSDPLGMTTWLNWWALYAYCFHVAWYRLLPLPYGALLSYGSVPLFFLLYYFLQLRGNRRQKRAENVGLRASDGEQAV